MRKAAFVAAASLVGVSAFATPGPPRDARIDGDHVIYHAQLDQHGSYANVWGYTAPNGREYALLGAYEGTAVIDITDRRGSREVGFVPGPPSAWREIKTYGSWAYVVSEGGGGLQIISLADPTHPALVTPGWAGGFATAHTLWIDETTGTGLICGRNVGAGHAGGVMILQLINPTSPTIAGYWDVAYAHDAYSRDGRMYVSAIYQGRLYILDIANLASPSLLGVIAGYPGAFTHNAGPTDDGQYVLTTDEKAGAYLRMWDISDPGTAFQTSQYRPPDGYTSCPHNVHVDGNLAYVSWYTMGVIVLDISNPNEMREVARFDTHPENNSPSFEGCWGVFPYYPNSPRLFVASDIYRGLFVLELQDDAGASDPSGAARPEASPASFVSPAGTAALQLGAPFPNPSRAGVTFDVTALRTGRAQVDVVDSSGRRVRSLGERAILAGSSSLTWDGRDEQGRPVAAGTYLVRVSGGGSSAARKVVMTR